MELERTSLEMRRASAGKQLYLQTRIARTTMRFKNLYLLCLEGVRRKQALDVVKKYLLMIRL